MLVLTVGNGVYGFTYDSIVGEFILSHPNMKARARARCASAFPTACIVHFAGRLPHACSDRLRGCMHARNQQGCAAGVFPGTPAAPPADC